MEKEKLTKDEFYKKKKEFLLDRTFMLLMLAPSKEQAEVIQQMRICLEDEYSRE